MTRAVIFDFDGVIVDSLNSIYEIYRIMATSIPFRLPESPRKLADMFGEGNFYALFRNLGIVSKEDSEKAIEIFLENEKRIYENSGIFPGIMGVIEKLKSGGYLLGVVSNNWQSQLEATLGRCGLAEKFDAVIGLNGIKKLKPDPALLLKCVEDLGVSGKECVYVGDMAVDIIAAKNAGLKSIGVTYGYNSEEKLKKQRPDYIAGSPEDIIGCVGKCLK